MKWVLIVVGALIVVVALVAAIGLALPKAHLATRTARFRRPPQAVWDVIAGPADWRPDIRNVEQLPPRDGRRTWKETDQHGQAITYESVEEAPPSRLVTRIADKKLPFGGTWTHEITADASGCTLKITEAGEVYNPIFRFMSRFVFGHTATIDAYLKALHAKLGD
jgi:polyketide cyclase/dehydrase/lipid transport protein